MKVHGDYGKDGYAHLEGLLTPEIAQALLDHFWHDLHSGKLPFEFRRNELLTKPAMELHSSDSAPVTTFLWGLTPAIAELVKCELLPTYAYFRLYQKDDLLRVHRDRPACEHSLSLTLGYSDGKAWAFDVGQKEAAADADYVPALEQGPYSTIAMMPGDAVLYRGIRRWHGRVTPNPNKWSAHLFLHWVDRAGEYREHAFEHWPGRAELAG